MTDATAPRIAELLASRICHDLVGSVGAIRNGMELMTEFGEDMSGDAMSLIASSAEQAARRLAAFRLAYGAGGADPHTRLTQLRDIFTDLFSGSHTIFTFDEAIAGLQDAMRPGMAKTLANAILLASECLGGTGNLSVSRETSGILVHATGERTGLREGVEDALEMRTLPENLDARLIQPYITRAFAMQYGISLIWKLDAGRLDIRIS
ncbi:MAG: hypothetical protein A2018_05390 [Alphaproteobacteria bacterium GWF2_58_20]|nr:MAG: hypothetical protein A2018_05390 [Alphaproteobacteria bacterium GWF2_58_20]